MQPGDYFVRFNRAFFVLAWLDRVRRLCTIRCEEIRSGNLNSIATSDLRESSQIDRDFCRAGSISIQHEENDFVLISVMNC